MNKKFDILITVYNKEKYLKKCLDSVVNQTYDRPYNIIIVDDGSTDSSSEIIKEYQKKYSNIIYYYKENTGVADTRNFAISKVKSDFFLFVDADDYLDLNLLNEIDIYCKKNMDVLSFSFYRTDEFEYNLVPMIRNLFSEVSGVDALLLLNDPKHCVLYDVPWGYAYRTEFFKTNNFEYVYGTEHEDCSLTPMIIASAKKVTSIKYKGYFYVQNSDSITHNFDTEQKRIIDKFNHLKSLGTFYNSIQLSKEELEMLNEKLLFVILDITSYIGEDNIPFYIKKFKELKMYEVIPNTSKTNLLYRFILKYFTKIPILFYLSYIYTESYDKFNIKTKNFLEKMSIDGKKKYLNILISQTKNKNSYYLMRIKRAILFNKNILTNLHILFNKNYINLNYIELCISTLCNLNCRDCSNLMPLYGKKAKNFELDYLLKQIDEFLKCVDYIQNFRILGGEPFLHPDLDKILEKLIKSKKVKKIMIVTNGSIIPKTESLINTLKNNKVYVNISNYPILEDKSKKLKKFLEKHNIHMKFYRSIKDNYWIDYGDIICKNKSQDELKKEFINCPTYTKCNNILDGKLYVCPRSSHLENLGIIFAGSHEHVDIMDNNLSIKEKKKAILSLLNETKCLLACNYCNIGTNKIKKIKPAIQLKKMEGK